MDLDRREFLGVAGAALAVAAGGGLAGRRVAFAGGDLASLDATAQAELVRQRKATPRELVEAAIARIEKVDGRINAVVVRTFEQALARAGEPLGAGPFAGVPFLVKNLLERQGVRITYGSRFFRDNVASYTHEMVRRFERAGLVILGSTNTCELGLLPTTEPLLHGPTRNPWDPDHSAGGSSGGAAAAVAAGIVPMAHASDGGGSIRIPAACCGVFGLKVSRGRNPEAPDPFWHGLPVEHCVSRTVRDSARLLDATRGPVAGDRWWAPEPARPFAEEISADPGRLRIAFATSDFRGHKAHADCAAAVLATAKLCADLGHEVEEAKPEIDGDAFSDAFLLLWAAAPGSLIKAVTKRLGKKPPKEAFEPFTWQLAELDARHTPADLSLGFRVLDDAGYTMARFLGQYDLLLTPVLGEPPVPIGELDQSAGFEALRKRLLDYVGYTPICNVTGQPAMSMPLHWNAQGLPIGVHFMARYGEEATLFRLASQLEQARPWTKRRPGVSAI